MGSRSPFYIMLFVCALLLTSCTKGDYAHNSMITIDISAEWLRDNAIPITSDFTDDDYCLLDESLEKSIFLYGVPQYKGMIICVEDEAYPIDYTWSNKLRSPRLLCDDYNGDGIDEFAIVVQSKTGTECDASSLLMFQLRGGDLTEICVIEDDQEWLTKFADIGMDYSETDNTSVVYLNGTKLIEIKLSSGTDYIPVDLGFGEIYGFTGKNGKLYFWIECGFQYPNRGVPSYEDAFILLSELVLDRNNNVVYLEPKVYSTSYLELLG